MNPKIPLLLFPLLLIACATNDPKPVCDEQGCGAQQPPASSSVAGNDSTDIDADRASSALLSLAASDPRAAYDLGLRYFRGDGVAQDSYQALQWMRSAAERGDLEAQKALGGLYLGGLEEMGADPQEAEKWLAMAAGRGDQESMQLLAQARAAKNSEAAYFKWKTDWREMTLRYWYSAYPYRSYWRDDNWHWR